MVAVVWTEHPEGTIRIISARAARAIALLRIAARHPGIIRQNVTSAA